jgi:hypothetical protein
LQIENEKENQYYSCRCAFEEVEVWTILPIASWVVPYKIVAWRTTLWKCMMVPQDVELNKFTRICYEHTILGSKLS